MQLAQTLFSQGFGTRRDCAALLRRGEVRVAGRVIDDPHADFDPEGFEFEVQGQPWAYHERALVMLHKPAGYECSRRPRYHPGVLSLLPAPLRQRGVQPVGRLDEDTTGLLLLTDDGGLIHRLTSPKRHVPKIYEIGTRDPLDESQLQRLRDGVQLIDDPKPTRIAAAEQVEACRLRLTITEGRYHQVKRMLAAVGNRVETLHRSTIGGLVLPADLPVGGWCFVDEAGRSALFAA